MSIKLSKFGAISVVRETEEKVSKEVFIKKLLSLNSKSSSKKLKKDWWDDCAELISAGTIVIDDIKTGFNDEENLAEVRRRCKNLLLKKSITSNASKIDSKPKRKKKDKSLELLSNKSSNITKKKSSKSVIKNQSKIISMDSVFDMSIEYNYEKLNHLEAKRKDGNFQLSFI